MSTQTHNHDASIDQKVIEKINAMAESNTLDDLDWLLIHIAQAGHSKTRQLGMELITSYPTDIIFPELEKHLKNNENADLRNAAIEVFQAYGAEASPYLAKLIEDPDEEIRNFVAIILGNIGDLSVIDKLIHLLNDEDENVVHAATESLGKLRSPRAVPALIACLQKEFWIQYPAVIALGHIGDPAAVEGLLEHLPDEMLQQAILEALGNIGDRSAIPEILKILSQADSMFRREAMAAIVRIEEKNLNTPTTPNHDSSMFQMVKTEELSSYLLSNMSEDDVDNARLAITLAGWLKMEEAIPDLLQNLERYELEEYIINALLNIGSTSVPVIISALNDEEYPAKLSLLRCLTWSELPFEPEKLFGLLEDNSEKIVQFAIFALGKYIQTGSVSEKLIHLLSDPRLPIQDALKQVILNDKSEAIGLKILGRITNADEQELLNILELLPHFHMQVESHYLSHLLDHPTPKIRAYALKTAKLMSPQTVGNDILKHMLENENLIVQLAAIECVDEAMAPELSSKLMNKLPHTNSEVSIAIIKKLGEIACLDCLDYFHNIYQQVDKLTQITIIDTLGSARHKKSWEFLADRLKHFDPDIRKAAASALGNIRDRRAVPSLIIALDDYDWAVRYEAIAALGTIGDRLIISHLQERLSDSEQLVIKKAISVLAALSAKESIQDMLPLLRRNDLKYDVLEAIQRIGIYDYVAFFAYARNESTDIKCLLIEQAGRFVGAENVAEHIMPFLEEEFPNVRLAAAKALGELGDLCAVPALLKLTRYDKNESVKKQSALSLRKLEAWK